VQPVIFAEQAREIDRLTTDNFQTPSLFLMEAAANACLTALEAQAGSLKDKKALVLCGRGNNGGDGAALARGLARVGVHCDVILFGKLSETIGDAKTNFSMVKQLAKFEAGSAASPPPLTFKECDGIGGWEQIARPRGAYDFIIDALFGTGLSRPLEGVYVKVIEHLSLLKQARNRASGERPLILSVDIPSGLNADQANPIGPAVTADLTVTFTAPKPANVLPPASTFCGRLVVADIGSPASLIEAAKPWLFVTEEDEVRQWLKSTRYTADSYKNSHGHVLIAAGSRDYTGAPALCGDAAMRSGAGLVTIATPASVQNVVSSKVMAEVITKALAETDRGAVSDTAVDGFLQFAQKVNAVAIGPGLTADDERTRTFVRNVVKRRTFPLVIDADGLNCLAPWPSDLSGSKALPIVLTPHPGEMMRLLGTDIKSTIVGRVAAARDFATRHKVVVVLKGPRSIVATPEGTVLVNPTGNPGLGTAGAGDTLTGFIAGFLAQEFATNATQPDPVCATVAALFVSGLAGDLAAQKLGMRTMVASDVRDHFSEAVQSLDHQGESPTLD
jgi:NAD(P)H-hydrate epimerase